MTDSLEIAKTRYEQGKIAFENGQYKQAVETLKIASSLVVKNSKLQGEIDIWLVNALEAAGHSEEAIALCQELTRHPHYETRHQAKRLVYILKAPKLKRPKEWMTEIPDLSTMKDNESQRFVNSTPRKSTSAKKTPEKEYIDLSTINTKDNSFVWVALTAVVGIISYLVWMSY
ncbi:tetratricopeptide repeat protein [Anabaena sp. FACHB-1237]|uniref:tetratricopeptide repeat protein n=1 Tax=Anabaena sp. FACHB-1237 TaxID=2692769 RepID=UPI001681840B|nr:tetratricopeptide repeat protein [Anabaena sp. FACHB-1237]MBD2136700.1 tetratricopeptide repeat protein [Anabaena sp. FACHB-1237]